MQITAHLPRNVHRGKVVDTFGRQLLAMAPILYILRECLSFRRGEIFIGYRS